MKLKLTEQQEAALYRRANRVCADIMRWDELRKQDQWPRSLFDIVLKNLRHERQLASKTRTRS